MQRNSSSNSLRSRLHEIIFEADTPAGKLFDILLILSIVASVVLVMLDSVSSIRQSYGDLIYLGEWVFTILFTIEYVLRLYSVGRPPIIRDQFLWCGGSACHTAYLFEHHFPGFPVFPGYPHIAGPAYFQGSETGAVRG